MSQRSLKVIVISAIRKLGCSFLFAFYSNYIAVSVAVCEIFSVKDAVTLKTRLGVVQGRGGTSYEKVGGGAKNVGREAPEKFLQLPPPLFQFAPPPTFWGAHAFFAPTYWGHMPLL